MPFDAGTAQGKLDLDSSGFNSALKAAEGALGGFLSKGGALAQKALVGGVAAALGVATAAAAGFAAALIAGSKAQAEYERGVVGLSNVLEQQGVPGFQKIVAEVEEYATAVQRVTGVQDDTTIAVAKMLAVVGVAPESLRSATQVVLDFAAATGQDAETAARLFGRTLQGNAGAVARYLPQVKELTAAQLRAGEAFNLAREATEGQAAALGETFTGRLERLAGSVEDFTQNLGKAFNNAFGPLIEEVQEVLDRVVNATGEGSEGFSLLETAAKAAADAIKSSFSFMLEVIADVLEFKASVQEALAAVQRFGVESQAALNQAEGALALGVGAEEYAQKLADGVFQAEQLALATERAAAEAREAADAARRIADGVDQANDRGASLADQVGIVADELVTAWGGSKNLAKSLGTAADNAQETAAAVIKVATAAYDAQGAAQRTRDMWARVNAEAESTQGSVAGVTSETRNAADAAEGLADSFDEVADSAASATAQVNNQIASLSASRHIVSRTALDFSDPFAAQAQASQAFDQLGQAGYNAYAGSTIINAARQFADGVRNAAQASFDRAFADFTAQVLSELSAAGIFDPAERSRILRDRIAEAQRFGILPETRNVQVY